MKKRTCGVPTYIKQMERYWGRATGSNAHDNLHNNYQRYLKLHNGGTNIFKSWKYVEDQYVYFEGTAPIMFVAHCDTVKSAVIPDISVRQITSNPSFLAADSQDDKDYIAFNAYKNSPVGFDDRAGIEMIADLVKWCVKEGIDVPSVLFTNGEERGGSGIISFIEDKHPLINEQLIIEIDRKGCGEAVYYKVPDKKFEQFINSYGFRTQQGSFTDIALLMRAFPKKMMVNLSAGYFNEHTNQEFLSFNAYFYTLDRLKLIMEDFQKYGKRKQNKESVGG